MEDYLLDMVMEDRINGGAGNVDDGAGDGNDTSEFEGEPAPDADAQPNESMDGDHASALASAGFGTDEDYGGGTHIEDFGPE